MNNYDQKINTEYLLPAPLSPPKTRRRRFSFKKLYSALCILTAVLTLGLCAVQKINEVLDKGVMETLGEILLKDNRGIGENVFGSPIINHTEVSLPSTYLTLPRIYYIPRESIVESSEAKAKELEKKIFELYAFDYSKIPKGFYPIVPTDISAASPLALKNDTSFEVNMDEICQAAKRFEKETVTENPLVLIVHTHGTEGFSKIKNAYYNDEYNFPRSNVPSENTVAVGKVLAEALNKKGIPTVQCETMHDEESYISAYERSAESIQHYLEKYPSIKYVFDVHRDSLIQSDMTKLRPVTIHGGKECAQIMMIVGSSEKSGIEYPWTDNLVLAEAIQTNLFEDTVGVARQIYLRGATYNQQYSRYGLLLEIGSCGNTLEEAKNAARAFADAFEKVIK
ncbi:MAG: stage II sporulation protein P [Clostridia bacterium]|nr:stage II sporulation protein P [Clostridia bacterium]